MKIINQKDFVDTDTIKMYQQIDGLAVIEECLMFNGEQCCHVCKDKYLVNIKLLENAAYILYKLKVTPTNKLYIGMYLDKFYHRAGLVDGNSIVVPDAIYNKVKTINEQYRNKENIIE